MVLWEGLLLFVMDDVFEVRFWVFELVDGGIGDMLCFWGRGIVSGEEGVFWVGRGDMRVVVEISGDVEVDLLLWEKKRLMIFSFVV